MCGGERHSRTAEDVRRLGAAGAHAVLVGESLMRAARRRAAAAAAGGPRAATARDARGALSGCPRSSSAGSPVARTPSSPRRGCGLPRRDPGAGRAPRPSRRGRRGARARAPRRAVGVFVDQTPDDGAPLAEQVGLGVLQLHGDEPPDALRRCARARRVAALEGGAPAHRRGVPHRARALRRRWPTRCCSTAGVRAAAGRHRRQLPLGGDRGVRERVPPGSRLRARRAGLRPENVARAIALLRADVVDVSSGVESAPGDEEHHGDPRIRCRCSPYSKQSNGLAHPTPRRSLVPRCP